MPRPEIIRLSKRVDPYHDGWTLLEFLCHRFRYLPRETWVARIHAGWVRVEDAIGIAGTVVRKGDLVEYDMRVVEPAVDFEYEVIHDDGDILVVSKSGNIPVHAGGTYVRNTLIARLREERGPDLALAHRLDRETSGLVVLTRTEEAARALALAFARGEVIKTYIAVVHGSPREDAFSIDAPLSRNRSTFPVARTVVDHERGKPSRTVFRVIRRLEHYCVLEARPETGRTNQVRVHLESAGHPIVGDKIYGMPLDLLEESLAAPDSERVRRHLVLRRHALHAWRISFKHPRDGSLLALEAPLPADMTDLAEGASGPGSDPSES